MGRERTYDDQQLSRAVAECRSWRGVLRSLGLSGTSAGAMRSIRSHADRLGLDYGHFTGQRRWTDVELRAATESSHSWAEVAERLGLVGGSSVQTVKGHARRLGLETSHFTPVPRPETLALMPYRGNLSRAGSMLAAAWFELCGQHVSWPLEPCRYDLLVWRPDGAARIQVKTTAAATAGDSWTVWLSTTGSERKTYDPDEIDFFFVIDGHLSYYLIPVAAVGGLMAIQLSAYQEYRQHPTW